MLSADDLFRRNFQHARSINYDLSKVHSADVCNMIRTSADSLLLDEQMLSLTLRTAAAFHLDIAKVRIDNDENREKYIVDYTLIITSIGSGKSTIFSKLSQATAKRDEFEKRRKARKRSDIPLDLVVDQKKLKKRGAATEKDEWSRHVVTNDFTGAGIIKSLNDAGNVFILIDEFDGEYQKSNIFSIDGKGNSNTLTSANGLLKTMHTGVDSYRKTRADGCVILLKPHVTFLGASNGSVVIEIIRQKLKTFNIPDAMVERFQWEPIMANTKLNSTRLVDIPPKSIGLELYFLASSLLSNHTFVFEKEANAKMCQWMDELALARARWDQIDAWLSGRMSKSIDQTARIAAQLKHIELTMQLLKEFVNTHEFNSFGSISFEVYSELADFIEAKYAPTCDTIIPITVDIVDAAIYSIDKVMIKYLNLFNTNPSSTSAILELPMHPPEKLETNANPSVSNLPTTQQATSLIACLLPKDEFKDLQKLIMLFPSIGFTRTMLYAISKLKVNQAMLDDLFESLLEIDLLTKFKEGVITGSKRSDFYVKSLPTTETLNTTNQFTLEKLDKINLPWLLYQPKCTTLLLPSEKSVLSDEADQHLQGAAYQNTVVGRDVVKKKSTSSIKSSQSARRKKNHPIMQSMESNVACSSNNSFNVTSPTRIFNANMPQPPSTSRALSTLSVPSFMNDYVDSSLNELNDDHSVNQQELVPRNMPIIDEDNVVDENDYPLDLPISKRRSARVQKRKQIYTAINASDRNKKKK